MHWICFGIFSTKCASSFHEAFTASFGYREGLVRRLCKSSHWVSGHNQFVNPAQTCSFSGSYVTITRDEPLLPPPPPVTTRHRPSPSATTRHHPPPPATMHHHPPPSATTATTNRQHLPPPPAAIRHHPPPQPQQPPLWYIQTLHHFTLRLQVSSLLLTLWFTDLPRQSYELVAWMHWARTKSFTDGCF